jgi:hypothetical protein
MRRPKQTTEKWGTAVHEAAHAVVGVCVRVPLAGVTIVQDEDSLGHVRWSAAIQGTFYEVERMNLATAILAARAAVESICPKYGTEWQYKSDERSVMDASGFMCDTDESYQTFKAWREECLDRARRIISWPHIRAAILQLATDLMHSKTLPSEHVRQLVLKCWRELPATDRTQYRAIERRFRQKVSMRELRALRKRARLHPFKLVNAVPIAG